MMEMKRKPMPEPMPEEQLESLENKALLLLLMAVSEANHEEAIRAAVLLCEWHTCGGAKPAALNGCISLAEEKV